MVKEKELEDWGWLQGVGVTRVNRTEGCNQVAIMIIKEYQSTIGAHPREQVK